MKRPNPARTSGLPKVVERLPGPIVARGPRGKATERIAQKAEDQGERVDRKRQGAAGRRTAETRSCRLTIIMIQPHYARKMLCESPCRTALSVDFVKSHLIAFGRLSLSTNSKIPISESDAKLPSVVW
jgi:hypothetical protein